MTDRHHRILASLVAEYIEQGAPVSSAWLAEHSDLGLSSATVRSILARLEEQGLVHQPHTSAGRVPTDHGYRLYVDHLLTSRRKAKVNPALEARLRRSGTIADLLEHASHEISRASHQIGFAVAPASPTMRLEHIDFVNLDGPRVLVIVVATGGQITHRVIETETRVESGALREAANYITTHFAGLTLDEARTAIMERMREERMLYDELMARALALAERSLVEIRPQETLHVQGTSFLIDELAGEATDQQRTLGALRELVRMIEEKHYFIDLLTRSIEAPGLSVVIGSEHDWPELRPFSVVIANFRDGDRAGTVGVIGPTRMRYGRAISVVDGVSQLVTRFLERQHD
jgi:heat-inducible transcriptional repressor